MAEPEAKKQKTEESKEPTAPPELEGNAKPSSSKPLKPDVGFETSDCTLNVIPSLGGRVLMPLTDGGMQYLIGGARANLGIKKGRYVYEVKVVESHNPSEGPQRSFRSPVSRNLVRVGFSLQGSPLLLGETDDGVYFDSDGFYVAEQKRENVSQRFTRDSTVAVVLNLDASSPNAHTVSLFRDGVRISQPQKLPEKLKGKTLFPHLSFKNMTVHVNFGPPLVPLPFTCSSVAEVPTADGEAAVAPPKDGKYEVIFPVAVPDEGTFDWLDDFLEKNPKYVELSDRAIIKWAEKSGITHQEANTWKHCLDKPDPQFRIPLLDDFSARRVIQAVAPTQPRHYVVMEVKSNLVKEERAQLLKRFTEGYFKTVAQVVMGEPPQDFKAKVHQALLQEKQEKATIDWKRRKMEKEQERLVRKRQRELEEAKKRAEEEAKKKLEELERERAAAEAEAAAAAEAEARAAAGESTEAPKEGEEAKDVKMEPADAEEPKAEVKDEKSEVKEEKPEVKDEPMEPKEVKEEEPEPEEPCPVAELTEEDKAKWFLKKPVGDLSTWTLGGYFAKFSIPEKDEGFGDVRYAWSAETAAKEYLANFIRKNKITTKMEELQPGEWFKGKVGDWHKLLEEWRNKQREFQMRPAEGQMEQEEAEAPKEEEPKPEGAAPEGEEAPKEGEEKKEEAPKEEAKEKKESEVDPMAVEDVCNVGNDKPLFAAFAFEDWTLLNLRAELHLLSVAFLKDAGDPERIGIHEPNLAFYYQKYFKKSWNFNQYGLAKFADLLDILKDAISVDSTSNFLQAVQTEDVTLETFLKYTEDHRRERERRVDAGDETAKLKFSRPAPPPTRQADKGGGKGSASGGGGKGRPAASYNESSYGYAKRPYQASSGGPPAKQPRTSYGSYGGGSYGRR
mmetsp:Transcript_82653/g.198349  ORF Transcript_82653/g.198349 Transcript_82653/m.198349 type:complete len:899 (-) Transcript_82653:71-2767(-)